MLPAVHPGVHPTIASSSSKGQFIRLEGRSPRITLIFLVLTALRTVISGKNIKVPSERIPAGIYISLHAGSKRRWKSTMGILSSEESLEWGDTVAL